jgi:hypothetical protein
MTNLYYFTSKNCYIYCFAHTIEEAIKFIKANCPTYNRLYSYNVKLVEDEVLQEDGVEILRKNNFVGIPEVKHFMLNGSVSAQQNHFDTKQRSARLWCSKEVPETTQLWK